MKKNIKWLFFDVDGTMTDGGVYYDGTGNEFKKFNIKDGAGILLAQKNGIQIVVITGRECFATEHRMTELGVKHLYQNVKDKKSYLVDFIKEQNIKLENTSYIGDDLNDLECMEFIKSGGGLCACPADAVETIRNECDFVCTKKGGEGAIRELIDSCIK